MNTRSTLPVATLVIAGMGVSGSGCDSKKEAPQQSAPAPVAVQSVDPMEGIQLDAKVTWPEKFTATTPEQARAIAALANALARGDADAAKGVLEQSDRDVLQDLMTFGDWADETKGLQAVRVCVLNHADDKRGVTLGLGVQDAMGAYMLAWTGAETDSNWVFTGMAIQPVTAASVAMLDGAELKAPVVAAAAVEGRLKIAANPGDEAKKTGNGPGGGAPGGEPPRTPFQKPRDE